MECEEVQYSGVFFIELVKRRRVEEGEDEDSFFKGFKFIGQWENVIQDEWLFCWKIV